MATKPHVHCIGGRSAGFPLPLAALAIVLIGLAVVLWPRGHKYPPATSREAYVIMDALHTACNTKNAGSLDKIEAWIAREKAAGKIGADEEGAFASIVSAARAGRWREADGEAIRFSQDQVRAGATVRQVRETRHAPRHRVGLHVNQPLDCFQLQRRGRLLRSAGPMKYPITFQPSGKFNSDFAAVGSS